LGKKQKIMTAIAMAVEGIELASDLMNTVQARSATARKRASEAVSSFRDSTTDVAEQLVDTVNKRFNRRPSAAARVWPFAAGLGVGVGAALLFAPMPGAEVRANLYKAVTRSTPATETQNNWQ
jgi:gas vesicle protein